MQLQNWGTAPGEVEVPVPMPEGEEVLLLVEAAGLCHSDLHIMDAGPGVMPYTLPFTLGHESVGTVVATGTMAAPDLLGGRFLVHGIWSCGNCRACQNRRDNYCAQLTGPIGAGIGYDGGLAEYLLVPSGRFLVAAAPGPAEHLAPLTDAALTAFHAIRPHRAQLPGGAVVVVGVGGLGHMALQLLAHHHAATVVGVDMRPAAREFALELGATAVAANLQEAAACVQAGSPGGGADLVLDFVGAQETLDGGAALLAPGGQLVIVGSGGGRLEVRKGADVVRGWGVNAPFWGTRDDLSEVVSLAARGALHTEVEVVSLDEVVAAYSRLRKGEARGRIVMVPSATGTGNR